MASRCLANELALSRDSTCLYSEAIKTNEVDLCCYLARVRSCIAARAQWPQFAINSRREGEF